MKIISLTEREFITNLICNRQKRLDGRSFSDSRTLEVVFGLEWGCCLVSLGNTRILAQVSAEVTEPKAATPTEGTLHINLELSFVSAPDVNTSHSSNEAVVLQRSLERCIRDSKCIDLESLCIAAGSKVWTIRVDVHALNDDGNLLECASIAAIAALAHFKRPDVTVVGTEVTVYSLDDREPVPLNLHHMPVIINLALFDQGSHILVDPTQIEEEIADGCYIIGMNAHQEICFIHRRGVLLLPEIVVQKCEDIVIRQAQIVTQAIRKALDDNAYKKATKTPIGFVNMLETGTILGSSHPIHGFDLKDIKTHHDADVSEVEVVTMDIETAVTHKITALPSSAAKENALRILRGSEAAVFEGGNSKWTIENEEDSSSSSEEEPLKMEKDISTVKQEMELDDDDLSTSSEEEEQLKKEKDISAVKQEMELSSEEETGFIESDQVDVKSSDSRSWYSKEVFQ